MTQQPPPSSRSGAGAIAPAAALIVGDAAVRLWGLTARERVRRQLTRLGVPIAADDAAVPPGEALLVFHGSWVYDEPLVLALKNAPVGTLLVDEASSKPVAAKIAGHDAMAMVAALQNGGALPQGLDLRTQSTLATSYNNKLRKRETPYLLQLSEQTLGAIEKRMFSGSYKGVTDLVTKYAWPLPARHVTRFCAQVGISPNMVTFTGLLLTIFAFQQFWTGHYASGLVAGWLMTFLDTVDGKLARVTMTSSKFGDIFDHGIDLIHPPFWYWAWVVGLTMIGLPLEHEGLILAIVVGGYVAQRLQEGLFVRLFAMHIHVWRPFDSFFRLITARRNPNLLLLTFAAIAGRPDIGMVAVAIWTLLCFGVHGVQIVQALSARKHGPIVSWLSR